MKLSFVPTDKMVERVPYADVDQTDVGKALNLEVRDVTLRTMDDGTIHVSGLPGGVIYHTRQMAVTGRTPMGADEMRRCVGCFANVRPGKSSDHAKGCPTGQNGTPNYE